MNLSEVRCLPIREKLQILEALWEEFSDRVGDMDVSVAERELLDHRLRRLETGEAEVVDWESVRESLGKR